MKRPGHVPHQLMCPALSLLINYLGCTLGPCSMTRHYTLAAQCADGQNVQTIQPIAADLWIFNIFLSPTLVQRIITLPNAILFSRYQQLVQYQLMTESEKRPRLKILLFNLQSIHENKYLILKSFEFIFFINKLQFMSYKQSHRNLFRQ